MREPSRASLGRFIVKRPASAALAVVSLALFAFGQPLVLADTKSELETAKERLDELEGEVAAAEARLGEIQTQADTIAAQVGETQAAIEAAEDRIAAVRAEIAQKEVRLAALQRRLDLRARDAYIQGPGGIFEVVFGSQSFGDLQARLALYNAIQGRDAGLAEDVERQRVVLERRRVELSHLRSGLVGQREQLQDQLAEVETKLGEARSVQAGLESKKAEAEGLVQTLRETLRDEEAAREAADLAGSIDGGAPSTGGGVLHVCPVGSPNTFYSDFGVPRPGGRTHQGNDIFAAYGTPIYAPFDGYAYDSSNDLGGNAVKVDGAGGYVYNAHLSSFGTLGNVSAGTIIGHVGNSGNARYTSPHDHFEWHPGGGAAVDPYPYLVEACR